MKITNKDVKLIGSAPSKEQLLELIKKWYCSNNLHILKEDSENENIFTIWFPETSPRAGEQLKNVIVRYKNGRYRFERMLEGK